MRRTTRPRARSTTATCDSRSAVTNARGDARSAAGAAAAAGMNERLSMRALRQRAACGARQANPRRPVSSSTCPSPKRSPRAPRMSAPPEGPLGEGGRGRRADVSPGEGALADLPRGEAIAVSLDLLEEPKPPDADRPAAVEHVDHHDAPIEVESPRRLADEPVEPLLRVDV